MFNTIIIMPKKAIGEKVVIGMPNTMYNSAYFCSKIICATIAKCFHPVHVCAVGLCICLCIYMWQKNWLFEVLPLENLSLV